MARHKARGGDRIKPPASTNACGVFGYFTRNDAQRRDSNRPDIRGHRREYRCDECGLWHLGHLPELVVAGVVTADEWYGRNGQPPYGEIIRGVDALLRQNGIRHVRFHRGPEGESWGMVARIHGEDYAVHHQLDPVGAAEAMLGIAAGIRSQDDADVIVLEEERDAA
jgi:hypothetical protein